MYGVSIELGLGLHMGFSSFMLVGLLRVTQIFEV